MKRILGYLTSMIEGKMLAGAVILALSLGAGTVNADAKGDLASRRSDFDGMKNRLEDLSKRVKDYISKTVKLREFDKTELDNLITQVCRLDIARDDDEADRLAKSLKDKAIENVKRDYDSVVSEGDKLDRDVLALMNDLKGLVDRTNSLTSDAEVKDDAKRLVTDEVAAVERISQVWKDLQVEYKTLTNVKEGAMNGSNNPRIRAAMEYGKEKHRYNQRICEEKELSLSSGRPDCVSFQEGACVVWEFKPDSYSEGDAKSQAERYLRDVQDKFNDDPRALKDCKKDSSGKPIFEARGVTYPRCKV